METRDSQIVPSLLRAAARLRNVTWATTTSALIITIGASVASVALKQHELASVLASVAVGVAAVLAAVGYGAIYQREKKVESTLEDQVVKIVSESLEAILLSRRKAALDLLFALAETSEASGVRVLSLPSLASAAGISVDEARELLEKLQQSGIVVYKRTTNEESVSLAHTFLANLLLESRKRILHDLLYKDQTTNQTQTPLSLKILLDSKDLINVVEHDRPIKLDELRAYLHQHHSSIVLTFNNIRELAAPLAQGINPLRVRSLLQRVETLPVSYLADPTIPQEEVKQAVRAFNSGTEYTPINPWVSRWDETIPGPRPDVAKMLILRLDEIVLDIAREDATVFATFGSYEPNLRKQFENDRSIPTHLRVPEKNFPKVISRFIEQYKIDEPVKPIEEFSAWVYEDPRRCPGLRLGYEVFHELLKNVGDKPDASDIPDYSQINAIPYVDVATLDRRMYGYCSNVIRKLQTIQSAIDYANRIFPSLEAFLFP